MEIYADYGFYENEYLLGKEAVIVEGLFPYYARVATQEIKNVIRLDMVDDNLQATEEMKMATCEIAELLASLDNNSISDADGNKTSVPTGVSSERVGEYSVTYSGNTASEKEAAKKQGVKSIVKRWLGLTGLLFRGV